MLDENSPIVTIAKALTTQLKAFGFIADSIEKPAEVFQTTITPRAMFLLTVLKLLDGGEAIKQAIAPEDPFIYNTAKWPKGCPCGGKLEANDAISLDIHFLSLWMFWNLQLEADSRDSAPSKIARAALWVLKNTGSFCAAISYILDLQISGFVLNRRYATEALVTLFNARRRVMNDDELIGFFLDETTGNSPDWTRIQFKKFNFDQPIVRPDIDDDFDLLIDRAESEIERVINAESYDDWLLGQLTLNSLLNTVHSIFDHYSTDNLLHYIARMKRIGEIRADAGGFSKLFKLYIKGIKADFTMAAVAAIMLSAKTEDWIDRILEDRAVVPAQLEQLLTTKGIDERGLTAGWDRVSILLAPIVAPPLLKFPNFQVFRTVAVEEGQDDSVDNRLDEIQSILDQSFEAANRGDKVKALDLTKRLTELYPYFHFGWMEFAIRTDEAGETSLALPSIINAIILEPLEYTRWQSLGVILKRLGSLPSAAVAYVVADALKAKQSG
jgi:hypothetical protein